MWYQLKSYIEAELRFRKWTVRVSLTIFISAILCVRALWIHYTKPSKDESNCVDFTVLMIDKLLDSVDAPDVDVSDVNNHEATSAGRHARDKRERCWVCKKSKPNVYLL